MQITTSGVRQSHLVIGQAMALNLQAEDLPMN